MTCGTEIDGDVFEDGTATHIRFTLGTSHHLLRQKACAALGMTDRVGLRMEYLGPDRNWFALVDGDDMEDAVDFARHPGPPEISHLEPEPEPEPMHDSYDGNLPGMHQGRAAGRPRVEKKMTVRLVVPGELVGQGGSGQRFVSPPRGTSLPEGVFGAGGEVVVFEGQAQEVRSPRTQESGTLFHSEASAAHKDLPRLPFLRFPVCSCHDLLF